VTEITPTAAVELRWPWLGRGAGATHVIEPVAQLVWTRADAADTPDDESTQLELDEGNLFALSRFPAGDRLERGLRANLGLAYTRHDPDGWSLGLSMGRIHRARGTAQFDGYEALSGARSDWLAALDLDLGDRLGLAGRMLFDEDLDLTRNELRIDWTSARLDLAGAYVWLEPSATEARPEPTDEWRVDSAWRLSPNWRARLDWRYNLERDRAAEAEFGLEYRTDCLTVDFDLRRRFTSSEAVDPTTDFGLRIALEGFGAADGPRPPSVRCRG
jgi:LPS-assembly protein